MSLAYYDDPRPDVQALIEPRGRRVLDVGCGSGALGSALKQAGAARVVGIEVEPEQAELAARRLDSVTCADALAADVDGLGGPFDVIVFADVLEHLPRPDEALGRLLPQLAPGGEVVISVPNMRFWAVLGRLVVDRWEYTQSGVRDRTHLRIFTRRALRRLVVDAGLEIASLARSYRLFEDQSTIGRWGVLATRVITGVVARTPARELVTFQYLVVARRPA